MERFRNVPATLRRIAGQAHAKQAVEAVLVLRTAAGAVDVFGFGPEAPGLDGGCESSGDLLEAGRKRLAGWAAAAA